MAITNVVVFKAGGPPSDELWYLRQVLASIGLQAGQLQGARVEIRYVDRSSLTKHYVIAYARGSNFDVDECTLTPFTDADGGHGLILKVMGTKSDKSRVAVPSSGSVTTTRPTEMQAHEPQKRISDQPSKDARVFSEGVRPTPKTSSEMVAAPSVFLIVLGAVYVGVLLLVFIVNLLLSFVPGARGEDPPPLVVFLPLILLFMCLGLIILYGGVRMRKREHFNAAMAGAIAAMLPCSLCCVIGLPLGIWCLRVLHNPVVKAAFDGLDAPKPPESPRSHQVHDANVVSKDESKVETDPREPSRILDAAVAPSDATRQSSPAMHPGSQVVDTELIQPEGPSADPTWSSTNTSDRDDAGVRSDELQVDERVTFFEYAGPVAIDGSFFGLLFGGLYRRHKYFAICVTTTRLMLLRLGSAHWTLGFFTGGLIGALFESAVDGYYRRHLMRNLQELQSLDPSSMLTECLGSMVFTPSNIDHIQLRHDSSGAIFAIKNATGRGAYGLLHGPCGEAFRESLRNAGITVT